MRILLITLYSLIFFSLTAQNVGINTNTPERTLHVDGELQVDSATYMHRLFLQNALDSSRMIFNPDSGSMEFWNNDTLWYSLEVNSPPKELIEAGDYSVTTIWGFQGSSPEVKTTYRDSDGNIIMVESKVVDRYDPNINPFIVTEFYDNGCLKEKTIEPKGTGGISKKISFDCPSGDTCLIEEIEYNPLIVNNTWNKKVTTTNVKAGVRTVNIERTEEEEANLKKSNLRWEARTIPGGSLIGGRTIDLDSDKIDLSLYGKNNQGFRINVEDITVNIDPDLVLNINEDDKKASFCNTKELEQKIDSTLKKRGILDTIDKKYIKRIETLTHFSESSFLPNTGVNSLRWSHSPLYYHQNWNFSNSSFTSSVVDTSNNRRLYVTSFPTNSFRTFGFSNSSLILRHNWGLSNATFTSEAIDTANNSSLLILRTPFLRLMQFQHSNSTVRMNHEWNSGAATFTSAVVDTTNNRRLYVTSFPSNSFRTFGFSNSSLILRHNWGLSNATFTSEAIDTANNSSLLILRTPFLRLMQFQHSNSTVRMNHEWNSGAASMTSGVIDTTNNRRLYVTSFPSNSLRTCGFSNSSVLLHHKWSLSNATFTSEAVDTATNNGIVFLRAPVLRLMSFQHSNSPVRFEHQWDSGSASLSSEVRDTASNSSVRITSVPSQSLMSFSAGSQLSFISQLDTTNKLFIRSVEDGASGDQMVRVVDPQAAIIANGRGGGDMLKEEQYDDGNGQVNCSVRSNVLGADILTSYKPDVLPQQSVLSFGASQNNLDMQVGGNLSVLGLLSKLAGSFKIDHPKDPYNKYLIHSFVESPDMMNIYNGNIITNENGEAIVQLPDYFDALNIEPRYQLTVIGSFNQAIIAEEVMDNKFTIKTTEPNVKVSWQVTGIRNDTYAKENRIEVEVNKPKPEQGTLLYKGENKLN